MRVAILSDTHIPDFARALPAPVMTALRRCDLILHAGDVTDRALLDELVRLAPVRVALGNRDTQSVAEWGAEPAVELEVAGVRLAMVHDAGPRAGREARLRRRFPRARLIVFGHSHIPANYSVDGVQFLNPGSPTWKRRQPLPSFGLASVASGRARCRIVEFAADSLGPTGPETLARR
jgi:putative phosphoesterase